MDESTHEKKRAQIKALADANGNLPLVKFLEIVTGATKAEIAEAYLGQPPAPRPKPKRRPK